MKPSEFQILILFIAFSPLVWWGYAQVELAEKRFVAVGYAALVLAYVATVVEDVVAPTLMDFLEHSLHAVAAVSFAAAAVVMLARLRQPEAGEQL